VRTCVIFNPAARGEKARRFRRHLDALAKTVTLKFTSGPAEARRLSTQAVQEGFELLVAAGGDGTLNEVLNGIGDARDGFERACLGVLPLGTVNVFAQELAIPTKFEPAWEIIQRARETRIDLPRVEYRQGGSTQRRYFAQLAGAGLDARAVQLVNWSLKKKVGPLAYVIAGLNALLSASPTITVTIGSPPRTTTGKLVLIGNGRLYGGPFRLFPAADLHNGLLEICIFPRADWYTLARYGPSLLLRRCLAPSAVKILQAGSFALSSEAPIPFQIDGELIGELPATFSVEQRRLRIIIP
jgi:diacylglycerol kinase (ATP)